MPDLIVQIVIYVMLLIVGASLCFVYFEVRINEKAKKSVRRETDEVFKNFNLTLYDAVHGEVSSQMEGMVLDGKFLIGKNMTLIVKKNISADNSAILEIKNIE